ncbi:hypothetical protein ACN4EG_06675 [Alkalinema pantanalense CENA528]|uniref:hypothetical protein n=1 Tax=Alkalinema pantanalense TaxID=1620705 RepID=UPI003D6E8068
MNPPSGDRLSNLSLSDLETLIQTIVQRTLRTELQNWPTPTPHSPSEASFLETFGTWEDDRPIETIVDEIYQSRTISPLQP